jgi:hypothetical protein
LNPQPLFPRDPQFKIPLLLLQENYKVSTKKSPNSLMAQLLFSTKKKKAQLKKTKNHIQSDSLKTLKKTLPTAKQALTSAPYPQGNLNSHSIRVVYNYNNPLLTEKVIS